MTGFGSASKIVSNGKILAELRSVNNRFLDCTIKLPEEFKFLEPKIRNILVQNIKRGKVDLKITITKTNSSEEEFLNHEKIIKLLEFYKNLKQKNQEIENWSIADLLKWPGVITSNAKDEEFSEQDILSTVHNSVIDFRSACEREGSRLELQVLEYVKNLENLAHEAKELLPNIEQNIKDRISKRLTESIEKSFQNSTDVKIQNLSSQNSELIEALHERIRIEASLAATKIDIAEEIERINSHLKEIKKVISDDNQISIGKRLDFLTQELHRESNTIGSKSFSIEQSNLSIEMRIIIEQIKEQIQNLQ